MNIRSWGEKGRPLLVLLHAQGCHGGWWDWVGPLLADHFHVVAPDFRGHGESSWADDYRWDAYAADIETLVEGEPCGLVGHSMGGYVALQVAARATARLTGVLIADMKTEASEQELADLHAAAGRPGRAFASLAEAMARYRLAPPTHCVPPERLAAVAEASFRQEPDGTWVSRFDRRALAMEPLDPAGLVRRLRCPAIFVRGEHSDVMGRAGARMLAELAGSSLIELPGLYHHLPLEAPEALASLIRRSFA